uniref:Vacuolar protein sorting-associated protein 8 homolog n=1 Tax=Sinocyclocheilus grahami TaxID=75366 RepID=A0A672RZQ8_SINGR
MAESPDSRSLVSASSQLNLMEIEAIDDKEFDIPQVDTPPTLESILNEPEEEDEPFILEDTCLLNTENIDAHSCETSSLSVYVHLRRRKAVETNATVHGSVLRRNLLKGISAQIVSAADKVDAGLPTAITVSNVIAVGTSHGLALVFDQNQALRLCLGTTATGAEYGAVSALSINHDCTRLLCGFAKGQVSSSKPLKGFIAPPAIIQRILQDPVYGKGKLAEIQGLILGMLETFNYEQTLLETTTNLLNSDLHWSLSHLRKAVSRGLHPRQDHCNICLQQYKRRQESEEEIIIFSCGHLYHCQCLQRKEVGVLSERQYSWSCYKCTSNQGTRPADRPSAESSRSCSTSLAQTKVMSTPHGIVAEAHGRKMLTEATLDAQQTQAWDHFRTLYRGPSRLAVLTELTHSHGSERAGLSNPVHPGTGSIYHSENVQLKLSPPPLVEE